MRAKYIAKQISNETQRYNHMAELKGNHNVVITEERKDTVERESESKRHQV